MAGARIQTTARQARPMAMPAVEEARISSSDRSGFCTSADASPMRAKNCDEQHDQVGDGDEPEGRPGPAAARSVAV